MSQQYTVSGCSYQTGNAVLRPSQTLHQKKLCCNGIRKVKSKGAKLVLMWTFLVYGSFLTLFWMWSEFNTNVKGLLVEPGVTTIVATIVMSCPLPFAGWISDVYFGRYKVKSAGLWLMWFGSVVVSVSLILERNVSFEVIKYVGIFPGGIALCIGFGAFVVNALHFGLDQMPEASEEEISAFIHWFVWVMFAGEGFAGFTTLIHHCTNYHYIFTTLIPVALLSVAICCHFFFRGWLIIEPQSKSQLKTVAHILKFAAQHKHPIRRSALTYCEDEMPSRLDLAKSKYGGPFTTEEVEDVKTFFRMLVVIGSTLLFFITTALYLVSSWEIDHNINNGLTSCMEVVIHLSYSNATFSILIIPLYETLIYPTVKNKLPSMLQRVVIGASLTLALSVIQQSMDVVRGILHSPGSCMFNSQSNNSTILDPLHVYTSVDVLSNVLVAIQLIVFCAAILEFTCAQAPYRMRGLLIGVVYSTISLALPLSYAILIAWKPGLSRKHHATQLSCDFWYFLFQSLLAAIALVVLCIAAKWYKRRQRDEPANDHAYVEEFYDKYCVQQT